MRLSLALREYWAKKLDVFQCKTPHDGLDTMVNIWTLYQAETCVVWSRFASFIEVGGRTGLGYRDTSQDVMSVVHTNPGEVPAAHYRVAEGAGEQGLRAAPVRSGLVRSGEAEGSRSSNRRQLHIAPDRKSR